MSVILVTGASTGIGQETALHLARRGHQVFAGVRTPATATELNDKIASENLSLGVVQLDITDDASVQGAIAAIMAGSGAGIGDRAILKRTH